MAPWLLWSDSIVLVADLALRTQSSSDPGLEIGLSGVIPYGRSQDKKWLKSSEYYWYKILSQKKVLPPRQFFFKKICFPPLFNTALSKWCKRSKLIGNVMINNSADTFWSVSINMLQNKYVTHYFWNTGSHILFIQQVYLQHNSRQSIRIILIGWDKYNRPMKIFRRNSFGCCNVN